MADRRIYQSQEGTSQQTGHIKRYDCVKDLQEDWGDNLIIRKKKTSIYDLPAGEREEKLENIKTFMTPEEQQHLANLDSTPHRLECHRAALLRTWVLNFCIKANDHSNECIEAAIEDARSRVERIKFMGNKVCLETNNSNKVLYHLDNSDW